MKRLRENLKILKKVGVILILFFPTPACLPSPDEETVSSIRAIGNQSADKLGRSVAAVGHVNRDSQGEFTDILVGAPSFDDGLEFSDKGAAYLIFGKSLFSGGVFPPLGTGTLSTLGDHEFRFPLPEVTFVGGQSGGNLGFSVSGIGDVNGDGFDDFLIGAPLVKDPNNLTSSNSNGVAYLVFGGAPLQNKLEACVQVPQCATDDRMILIEVEESGERNYIVVMSQETLEEAFIDPFDQTIPNPLYKLAFVLRQGSSQSNFGFSLAGLGDVNGDGCPDFLIGAPFNAADRSGGAYLYLGGGACNGGTDLLSLSVTPTLPPIAPAAIFTGVGVNDHLGLSLGGVGDTNGDGFFDMLIGAPTEVPRGGFAGDFEITTEGCGGMGHAYLFLGKTTFTDITSTNAEVTFTGNENKDCFGIAVSGAGDANGDGRPDLIIGAPVNDGGGATDANQGAAFIYWGSSALGSTVTNLLSVNADLTLQGSFQSDFFGSDVAGSVMPWNGPPAGAGLWDLNGDGISDFAIGATNARVGNGPPSGAVYMFFGGPTLAGTVKNLNANKVFAGENNGDLFGISIDMAGDFNNDGLADFLIGSPLNDNNRFTDNGLAILHLF
ncbi:MAG TPA: integrin alpha [Nitrospiria bacterium]|jgi:hypothetical protein